MRVAMSLVAAVSAAFFVSAGSWAATLNEIVVNDVSTDDREFIEICGLPGESLDGLSLVVIEGEPSSTGAQGTVDVIIPLTGFSIDASGLFVVGDAAVSPDLLKTVALENGAETIFLVRDVAVTVGTDIDADNDCNLDVSVGTIVDGVAFVGIGSSTLGPDCAYYSVVVGPDGTFDPAGAARCEDCTGAWGIICLNGTEPVPTGSACPAGYVVEFASPGSLNCPPVPVEMRSWGSIKNLNR